METRSMKPIIRFLAFLAAALTLTACGREDAASYMFDGPRKSLALLRDKPFAWSKGWDLSLVTANMPDCMRRNKVMHSTGKKFQVELYQTFDGAYILSHEGSWFVTEIKECRLQQFKTPPPEPGKLIGTFEMRGGELQFVATEKPAATAPDRPRTAASSPAK